MSENYCLVHCFFKRHIDILNVTPWVVGVVMAMQFLMLALSYIVFKFNDLDSILTEFTLK